MDPSEGQFEVAGAPVPVNSGNCFFCNVGARMRNLTISLSNLLFIIFVIFMLGTAYWMRNSFLGIVELALAITVLGMAFWMRNSFLGTFELAITICIIEEKLNKLHDTIMGSKLIIVWILVPTFISIFQAIGSRIGLKEYSHSYEIPFLGIACFSLFLFTLMWLTSPPGYDFSPTIFIFFAAIGTISMIGVKIDENNPFSIVCMTGIIIAIMVDIKMVTIFIAIPNIIVNSIINAIFAIKFCNLITQRREKNLFGII